MCLSINFDKSEKEQLAWNICLRWTCSIFDPSAEYLPCLRLRYAITPLLLLRLPNVMMTKSINFNTSTNYVYYVVVMTKNIKINSSTTFTTLWPWQKNIYKISFWTTITGPWSPQKKRSSLYCHYVHYAMVMSKKYEVSFHHYTHYVVIHQKKINFCLETIATTFTT